MPSWLPPGRTAGFLEWLGGGGIKREVNEEDRMRGEEEERVQGDKGGEKEEMGEKERRRRRGKGGGGKQKEGGRGRCEAIVQCHCELDCLL